LEGKCYENRQCKNVRQYIENTYQLLETVVIPGIETFKEHRREEFRSQIIKKPDDFPDYKSYLLYLKGEAQRRYSDDNDYYIDNVVPATVNLTLTPLTGFLSTSTRTL
jgi:hypothetical protein